MQGLIQKEIVDVNGEKVAQISVVAKKDCNANYDYDYWNYDFEVETSYTLC